MEQPNLSGDYAEDINLLMEEVRRLNNELNQHKAPYGSNAHGLDANYFHKNLARMLRDVRNYTPDEMSRSLIRLAMVGDPSVLKEQEFHQYAKVPIEGWSMAMKGDGLSIESRSS